MKKRTSLIALGLLSGLLLSGLWIFSQAYAQIDAFTFFVPYPSDRLAEQFATGGQQPPGFTVNAITTTVSISVLRDGSVIYYDHWEDGLEPNITLPIQASTEIFSGLSAGDVVTLQCTVEVPRSDPPIVRYDGGDKIVSVGGGVAVTLSVWPDAVPDTAGILFAGAWELYPTSRWGTNYMIPVGQDLSALRGGFTTVSLNVQAVEDNTTVQLDLDANGDFEQTVTLGQGGQFTQVGGVIAGAQVQSSRPVQVHVFAKDPRRQYEARAYTMLVRDQWTDGYVAPRSSDGDYWLYNPNPTLLTVTVRTVTDTTVISIPAASAARYPPLPSSVLTYPTGAHFISDQPFYGVAALDDASAQDWGYALIPIGDLTTQALIGWAPGNNNSPPDGDESRVYVTAVTTTTIYVDYDNDGTVDGNFLVPPLAEVPITDADHILTGARLYTTDGVPFSAVWGQDQGADPQLPSIDLGTTVVPLVAPSIQKTYTLLEEGYSCGTMTWGHVVRFQLQVYNDSANDINDVVVRDTLQAEVAYITNTTTVGGLNISDDSSGTPFPLDEGGYDVGTIAGTGVISITYDTVVENPGMFTNRAEFVSPSSAAPAIVTMWLPFRVSGYDVTKTLIEAPGDAITSGHVITFGLSIVNIGNSATITTLPLEDTFDERYLTFLNASVAPTIASTRAITWDDLTIALGDLPPGTSRKLEVGFTVNDIPKGVTGTTNTILSKGVEDSAGRTQRAVCDVASVAFAQPTPGPEPTTVLPTPTPPPQPSPTPTSAFTPVPTPTTPTPSVSFLPETGVGHPSVLPLRSASLRSAPSGVWDGVWKWPLAALPVLGVLALWMVRRRRD